MTSKMTNTTSKFKPSDKVAAADPYELKHSWVGEVVSVDGEIVLVYWPQREGSSVNPTEEHLGSYLRVISMSDLRVIASGGQCHENRPPDMAAVKVQLPK